MVKLLIKAEFDTDNLAAVNYTIYVRAMDSYSRWGELETVNLEVIDACNPELWLTKDDPTPPEEDIQQFEVSKH